MRLSIAILFTIATLAASAAALPANVMHTAALERPVSPGPYLHTLEKRFLPAAVSRFLVRLRHPKTAPPKPAAVAAAPAPAVASGAVVAAGPAAAAGTTAATGAAADVATKSSIMKPLLLTAGLGAGVTYLTSNGMPGSNKPVAPASTPQLNPATSISVDQLGMTAPAPAPAIAPTV